MPRLAARPAAALGAAALALLAWCAGTPPEATASEVRHAVGGQPIVAVASSLRSAWPALEAAWRVSLPGVGARPTFGASRTLARQIARGAPFELFLSADEASLDALPPARIEAGSRARYAEGRLVLVTREAGGAAPAGASSAHDPLASLASRLATDPDLRVAIANPAHAPYGRAARESLASEGLWPLAPERLVTGENAAQTLQFLLAGAVDAAFVPAALVADGPPPGTRVQPIDPTVHAPLVHALVVVADASAAARALAGWFASPSARDALAAAGLDAAAP